MNKKIPQHIAFILDGNRRWARAQGLPTLQGHMEGMNNVERIGDWCIEAGVKYLTVYAFSTENWKRSQEELNYLFTTVFDRAFVNKFKKFNEKNIKVNVFGELEKFPEKMCKGMKDLVEQTRNNTGLIFNVCLNYGGRPEIVRAVKNIVKKGIPANKINEEVVANHLYSAGMPDPDLMIRTGGERRLSGFLLWQQAYTELYFPEVFLPGFSKNDFNKALAWYASRDRRHGGDSKKMQTEEVKTV